MREIDLPPRAAALSESLRDLGYTIDTAVADIIDNSIASNATKVDIWCAPEDDNPTLAIVDNGDGMARSTLIEAMRYGSKNPRVSRKAGDLGRFGLGLKTASFSQCRRLTVVSAHDERLAGATWDLDKLADDAWTISVLDKRDCEKVAYFDSLDARGTLVLWEGLDRLTEQKTDATQSAIVSEKLLLLGHHLSLVFHRFLAGEVPKRRKLVIKINGHKILPFDPFCRGNKATNPQPPETVEIEGSLVQLQAFILPHHSKLSRNEFDFYRGRSDFLSNQGAYVYRSGRLMAWGDWFRLIPKGESTKLARVQIDFSADLDELWTIDIKKARAQPPHEVREKLKQIIGRIAYHSTRVHSGRGRKLFEADVMPMWSRYPVNGAISYRPSMDHPLVKTFSQSLSTEQCKHLKTLLQAIGSSIPVEAIYSDYSLSPKDLDEVDPESAEALAEKLSQLREVLDPSRAMSADHFRRIVKSTRLVEGAERILTAYIDKEF
ncbi:ATP-binding protein [Rhizobium leguminosarum]|uniref:ATP-binding protein n=1 Tax=Rhizobium leguminosarum TaxID=384 RepID=UPI001C8FBE98|nr:ATP-binding protein [Rhizobium leguminosarum]MBY3044852.1 ATP-binding protein [Rhizobium leguminosarum]